MLRLLASHTALRRPYCATTWTERHAVPLMAGSPLGYRPSGICGAVRNLTKGTMWPTTSCAHKRDGSMPDQLRDDINEAWEQMVPTPGLRTYLKPRPQGGPKRCGGSTDPEVARSDIRAKFALTGRRPAASGTSLSSGIFPRLPKTARADSAVLRSFPQSGSACTCASDGKSSGTAFVATSQTTW